MQGICTWVAGSHAVRLVKATSYMTVSRLMKLACLDNVPIRSLFISDLIPTFQRLGIRVTSMFTATATKVGPEAVLNLAKSCKGVILFTVRWGNGEGHSLVASFSAAAGKVHIIDRAAVAVESFSELDRFYPGISTTSLESAYLIEDAHVKLVSQAGKSVPMIGAAVTLALYAMSSNDAARPN